MTDALKDIAKAYNNSSSDEEQEEITVSREDIETVNFSTKTNFKYSEVLVGHADCKEDSRNTDSSDDDDDDDDDNDNSSNNGSNSSSESSPKASQEVDSHEEEEIENTSEKRRQEKIREKGEYDDLPPIEDLKISVSEVVCDRVGQVGWIVDQMVVVTPKPLMPTLNIDTVLFIEKGHRVLGHIFDVFGPVYEPHYCVRFNNSEHVKANKIEPGMIVYYCPNSPYTTLVFVKDLLKIKATDDIFEDEHPAFSDDEEERAYYAALKKKQTKNNEHEKNLEIPQKRARRNSHNVGWKSKHPWSSERVHQHQKQNYPSNMWPYSSVQYNHWHSNSLYFTIPPRPLFNTELNSYYLPSPFQSNVHFSQQPRPSSACPNNDSTYIPAQVQSALWCAHDSPSSSFPPPPPTPPEL